jgi:hypothetical protein
MEHQQAEQIEQRLRRNCDRIRHRITDQFMETSRADLDAAIDTPKGLDDRYCAPLSPA